MHARNQTMVVFAHPFLLSGINGEQPSGSYSVETVEEVLETPSRPVHRRISTSIQLPARPGPPPILPRIVAVDPIEFAIVRARDALPRDVVPLRTDHHGDRIGKNAADANAWRRWVALNANDLAWMGLVIGAVVLAGLISR